MAAHIDILEERESLKKPLLGSVLLHSSIFGLLALQTLVGGRPHELWGDPNSLGGSAVGITPVAQIPLPSRGGLPNPLASDTESQVPEPPAAAKAQPRPAPKPDEPAIAIKGRSASKPKPAPRVSSRRQRSRVQTEENPGQVYSDTGRALSSPMVGRTGSGGVGIGTRGAFGYRFGYYRSILEQRIAQKWRTDDVDPRLQTAPTVIVTFEIHRDGSTSDVRVEQSSGYKSLDYSALRAVYEASPFPRLPAEYNRDSANIEIWFQLQR
jgi:protein TonB